MALTGSGAVGRRWPSTLTRRALAARGPEDTAGRMDTRARPPSTQGLPHGPPPSCPSTLKTSSRAVGQGRWAPAQAACCPLPGLSAVSGPSPPQPASLRHLFYKVNNSLTSPRTES